MPLPISSTGVALAVVCAASITDLRSSRIPNFLTFPAIGLGLVTHLATAGWEGLLFAAGGAVLAAGALVLIHGGRGPGMGDVKLAAAIGANLGPVLGVIAVLISGVAGGVLAALWVMSKSRRAGSPFGAMTIPYGVAMCMGTLVSLVAWLWTGNQYWPF